MAEQILIEFITDSSQLAPAVDQLEQMGKVEKSTAEAFKATNKEAERQAKILNQVAAAEKNLTDKSQPLKKTLVDINSAVKGMSASFQKEFQKGVQEALQEAGVEAKEFEKALEQVGGETTSLKSQLREMIAQLSQMKVEGKDNTEQYKQLAQQAGRLKDAIADANQEVKNFGSDTGTIDGIISLAGGIAGGFAVAQGATALFGDESEELQKVLLRVNAAMAILQGLQQIQTVLQKESAAATLANTIVTRAQTVAQIAYNFVVGSSVGVLKAFRIALAATGVGLFIILIYELVQALKNSNDNLEETNNLLEYQKNLLDAVNDSINNNIDLETARANAAGAAQSEIVKIQGRGLVAQRKALIEQNEILAEQRAGLKPTTEAWANLNKQIFENNRAISSIDNSIEIKALELQQQVAEERKKAAEDAKKAAEDAAQQAKELRASQFADFKAKIEQEVLAAKDGSEEQLNARKRLALAQLQIDLNNEKLTENQRKLLIKEFFAERLKLEREFGKNREKFILENILSDLNAELQALELSNERRLELTESTINLQAEMEITSAEGNAAKITEINAKRDKAIRDARLSSIQEVLNYELSLSAATNGPRQRRLKQLTDDATAEKSLRILAVNEIEKIDSEAITKRINALNTERQQGLISQNDYNLQYAQLVDQQTQVWEDASKKRDDITKQSNELAKQKAIELTQTILDAASQVVSVLDSLYQLQADKENQALDSQKAKLKELQEAGAITEKEATTRQKKIEAEERRIRRLQAEREKRIAVFNAALAVPQAVLKGLTTGGPILAAVYGALAAAQLAITAARPIPKFGKGKKDKYQGFGEVGETGSELVQSNGRMYVATKPQIVWLGKDDKVYNPQETAAMISKPGMNTERILTIPAKTNGISINYKKLGEEVGKHTSTTVYVDGVKEQLFKAKQFEQWLTKRRSF